MRRLSFSILIFFVLIPVWGYDLPISKIADDSVLRTSMIEWMTEAPARVLSKKSTIQQLPNGERVEVRTEAGKDEFMVIFSRELMRSRVLEEQNPVRRGTGQFPGWAQGSWMLTRKKNGAGEGTLIRVFPRSDQYTYIQFSRFSADKSQIDAVVYGGYIVRSLPISVPFERLYTMQLNDILKLAGDKFPRKYFEVDPTLYRDSRNLISQVRPHLAGLNFNDDGAIDENGNYVFIETLKPQNPRTQGLNCSGFVKWLIDGLLRPVTGERLKIEPLKKPFGERGSSFSVNWEESRDPYFGLDWIRNLASAANGILRSEAYKELIEFEVRDNIISSVMINENKTFVIHSYTSYFEEAGFAIEGLYPLLYVNAVDDPFRFYLAAVSAEVGVPVTKTNPHGAPRLRQYYHVAALIPYFDEFGTFRIVVFESASETNFNAFRTRYPGHHINLVRIPISSFEP